MLQTWEDFCFWASCRILSLLGRIPAPIVYASLPSLLLSSGLNISNFEWATEEPTEPPQQQTSPPPSWSSAVLLSVIITPISSRGKGWKRRGKIVGDVILMFLPLLTASPSAYQKYHWTKASYSHNFPTRTISVSFLQSDYKPSQGRGSLYVVCPQDLAEGRCSAHVRRKRWWRESDESDKYFKENNFSKG